MKRIFKIIFLGTLIFVLASFSAKAESVPQVEYIVSDADGEYLLSGYSGGSMTPIIRSESTEEITEYLNAKSERISVVFNGISVDEDISLSCAEATLSGAIVFDGDSSLEIIGGKIRAESLKASFDEGALIIKDGSFFFAESEISSKSTSVIMNYSAGARAYFESGKISGDSTSPGVSVELGQAFVYGCTIYNESGCAISNSSSLSVFPQADIVGDVYDIITQTPITLNSESTRPYANLKVKYDKLFEKGTIKCVFYSATPDSLSNISFFDGNGAEQLLTYFESYEGMREKNFGAIYLPYSIDFYCGDTVVATQKIISDARASEESAPLKNGYDFVGWSERGSDELYDFAQKVKSDFSLYATYKLTPPQITLSSFEFTYDGRERNFGITGLSHPLVDAAIINYEWYYNGNFYSDSGPQIKLKNVSQSGDYYCVVSFTHGTDTVRTSTPTVSVRVNKYVVPIPSPDSKIYNGEHRKSDISENSYYSVTDFGGVVVGTYPVVLTLKDKVNCEFPGGNDVVSVDFMIEKAENFWVEELTVSDVYHGMKPSNTAHSRFGNVKYIYSDKLDGVYFESFPSSPGTYYCKAYVSGCENYGELYSDAQKFNIIEELVSGISILNMPNKSEYTAFESFESDGLSLTVTYNSGRVEAVSTKKLAFSYQSADTFRYGDKGITATYLGVSITIPLVVKQARYELSEILFESGEMIFNGNSQTLRYSGALPIGKDDIQLSASVVGGGTNVGTYAVSLVFSTQSKNYELPEPIECTLTILPYKSTVVFSNSTFVYDGEEKCPTAYYRDVYGRKITAEVEGGRSFAGEYVAVAFSNDSNYHLESSCINYFIRKADYDFSNLKWIGGKYVYDGEEKCVYLEGLPIGVTVVGYSDNAATCAGVYTAKATFSYDERNYNAPPDASFEWRIEKAEYAMDFEFLNAEFIYDGQTHYPVLNGEMPVGIDGITLEYAFSTGATHVNEGVRRVEISFYTKSPNYNVPDAICATVKILPLGISVIWENLSFTYDSFSHAPSVLSDVCSVIVLGAEVDAGTYTAIALSPDSDYYVINSTIEYTIEKAENFWTHKLEIDDIYEGQKLTPRAECVSGEVSFVYYALSGEEIGDVPHNPGRYYVKAFSVGSFNYKSIASDAVSFEIIKVVPIFATFELTEREYKAFEVLTNEDVRVILLNNDGSTTTALFDEITVSYENADSFRVSDSYVLVGCGEFSEKIDIRVSKADYEMSHVRWSEESFVYDGEEKSVALIGLPSGLSIREYVGARGRNAGEYTARAIFEYDSLNYNPPRDMEHVWIIEKQNVAFPVIKNPEYNGTEQGVVISDTNLYTVELRRGVNAGYYPVILRLTDPDNYKFGDFGDSAIIYYEIMPRVIAVKLSDIDKHLLSSMPDPECEIVDGCLVDGEELELVFIYAENEVYCKTENPNYSVRVIPGRITRHNSLSEHSLFLIFVLFVLLLLLTLLSLFVIYKRRDIAHYIYVLKCKLSPTEEASEGNSKSYLSYEEMGALNGMEQSLGVDAERADSLISDALAKNLLRKEDVRIKTNGRKKRIINVDTLSENYLPDERVDVNSLKAKNLIPSDTAYIKVLARGTVDKALKVYANDFSLSAVKMIALSGGESVKVVTVRTNNKKAERKN